MRNITQQDDLGQLLADLEAFHGFVAECKDIDKDAASIYVENNYNSQRFVCVYNLVWNRMACLDLHSAQRLFTLLWARYKKANYPKVFSIDREYTIIWRDGVFIRKADWPSNTTDAVADRSPELIARTFDLGSHGQSSSNAVTTAS